MAEKKDDANGTRYRDNEIDGFRMGALFDLRVRMAYDMLVQGDLSSLMWGLAPSEGTGKSDEEVAEARGAMAARAALACATELVRLAEAGGLVDPFPPAGTLSRLMRLRGDQLAEWQATQAVANHRKQQDMAGRIAVPPGTQGAPILPPVVGPDGKPTK